MCGNTGLRLFCLVVVLCLLLVIAGCASSTRYIGEDVAEATRVFDLTSPCEMNKNADWLVGERLMTGACYSSGLPNNLVSIDVDTAVFAPNWQQPDSAGMENLAYAIYTFTLTGSAGDPVIDLKWAFPPPESSNLFIGLGNWRTDRWDWYSEISANSLVLDSTSSYVDSNDHLFIAIALTGTAACQLEWARCGGNLLPDMDLTATPIFGDWLLEVSFDASGSSDPDGTITQGS